MPRRGENIYKRKDGRWEGRYIRGRDLSGKAQYGYLYARTYWEVKSKLQTVLLEKEIITEVDSEMLFKDILQQWLLNIRPQIKESSYMKYNNIVKNHLLPYLGELSIQELTTSRLEAFAMELFTSGKKKGDGRMAAKSVKDILAVIKSVQEFSMRKNCDFPCNIQHIRIKSEAKEITVLNYTDQKYLEQYLLSQNTRICDGIILCLYTGIRIGELCALRWENILLDEGLLQIRCTLQRIQTHCEAEEGGAKTRILISPPKSKCSSRDIPLPEFLAEHLRNIAGPAPHCFFLTGTKQYLEPRSMSNQFKYILRALNITYVNFHVLRHTFATRCVENNFDIKALSEILGHSSVNITLNRYVHTSLEQKRINMKKLNL